MDYICYDGCVSCLVYDQEVDLDILSPIWISRFGNHTLKVVVSLAYTLWVGNQDRAYTLDIVWHLVNIVLSAYISFIHSCALPITSIIFFHWYLSIIWGDEKVQVMVDICWVFACALRAYGGPVRLLYVCANWLHYFLVIII